MAILVRVGRPTAVRKSISLCSEREREKKENSLFGRCLRLRACVRACARVCVIFSAHMVDTTISYMHKKKFLRLVNF